MRQLGVVKGDMIVGEVGRQLLPVIVLENDRPEHKFLGEEALAWGQNLTAAIAAITSFAGLRNPAGSGKILVVERVLGIRAATGQRMYYGLARSPTVTQVNTEQPRDTRQQPSGAFGVGATGIVGQIVSARSDTIVVTPFVVGEFGAAALNASAQIEPSLVLAADDTLLVWPSDGAGSNTVNAAIQASFFWRERALEPTEL